MERFETKLVPPASANSGYSRLRERSLYRSLLRPTKLLLMIVVAAVLFLEQIGPLPRSSSMIDSSGSPTFSSDPSVREVMTLAKGIRFVTNEALAENNALRYAGLIFHASRRYAVNPLEIIAIIMAESEFKERSVNAETGDYGLGQINWEHWGKPFGLTPQDLLDPSVNITLICHVYDFFERDVGRYHRGNGIKCTAYQMKVKAIVSALSAFVESNRLGTS